MSPSHFLCWDSSGPLCPKLYFSSFAEITGNTLHQGASQCWGLGWKRDATVAASIPHLYSFFKSQLLIFHFKTDLQQLWIGFYYYLLLFPKFVIEKDRSPSGTLDSGCTGLLQLLAAAPCWYGIYILLGEKETPCSTCFTPYISQVIMPYSVIPTQNPIICGWTREKNTQSHCNLFLIILYFLCISTTRGLLHRNNCSEKDEHLQRVLWERRCPDSEPQSKPYPSE